MKNKFEDIVFTIPVDDLANRSCNLYYRPLTGEVSFCPSTHDDKKKRLPIHEMSSMSDIRKMSILPNNRCNFNCSYCYAAQGRDHSELSEEVVDKALDFFLDRSRTVKPLSVAILGGGEPMLSWNVTRHAIERARFLAKSRSIQLQLTLVTNASLVSEEMIQVMLDNEVVVNASFDLIEDVQEHQRKNFSLVKENIERMSASGVYVTINSTITPMNVERMDEMVRCAAAWFSRVRFMAFEPVISMDLFQGPDEMHDFYQKYMSHFEKVRRLAESLGLDVTCRILKSLDSFQDRGCEGRFNICPNGDVTICYCTASDRDPNFENRLYGKVTADGVRIFEDQFEKICSENVFSFKKCDDCFARFNCAGGCMLPNDRYSDEFLEEVCFFNREFIRRELYNRATL